MSKNTLNHAIDVKNARVNNLQGTNCSIPLNSLTVITGRSGSGKSSLAFHTLYAEGRRRYVETFSPYLRQFFDRMDKPAVDSITRIPPAVAIEQTNQIRSTKSTVSTLTELNDHLKFIYPRLATGKDPTTGETFSPETPQSIWKKIHKNHNNQDALLCFPIQAPRDAQPKTDFFDFLAAQGYLRIIIYGKIYRTDTPATYTRPTLPAQILVIQDRIKITEKNATRCRESIETCLHHGSTHCTVAFLEDKKKSSQKEATQPTIQKPHEFIAGWHLPSTGEPVSPPTPALFNTNSPIGACNRCRGFGKTIAIDPEKVIPDDSLSLNQKPIAAFTGNIYSQSQLDLLRCSRARGINCDTPIRELSRENRDWLQKGEAGDFQENWENGGWYGIDGFFNWLESQSYKMHVRVFLSRFRSHTTCPDCQGSGLTADALLYHLVDKNIADIQKMTIQQLHDFFIKKVTTAHPPDQLDTNTRHILSDTIARLRYLVQVGLGYLHLQRESRTLSGGEIARINLTSCLGSALTHTLFVLDEPSIGLHPHDIDNLIKIIHELRDRGNTLVVVEHEESIMRAADTIIDIGPQSGENGGQIMLSAPPKVFFTTASQKKHPNSPTLHALTNPIPLPKKHRVANRWLSFQNSNCHNIQNLDVKIPLDSFCCLTGISGSGKSTLAHNIIANTLSTKLKLPHNKNSTTANCKKITGIEHIKEVIHVDQSRLTKSSRSTPAVYLGIFYHIRCLFARTPQAIIEIGRAGYFSFNAGAGRCSHCAGAGYEEIDMQFLSNIHIPCPLCHGSRFSPAALAYKLNGKTITDVLNFTFDQTADWIATLTDISDNFRKNLLEQIKTICDTGLGYLRLGQPMNTVSGGEAQRIKLLSHILSQKKYSLNQKDARTTIIILDEPTTGLHLLDIRLLLDLFRRLVDHGNSLIIIEHNLEIIKSADYIIDLGPEAGADGGQIVTTGTPEKIVKHPTSHTAAFLRPYLSSKKKSPLATKKTKPQKKSAPINAITIRGAREHNLQNINLSIPLGSFVAISGLSGSGKSSLAFNLIFAEGQRRFLDILSPYARQFAEQLSRPEVDIISGLPPVIAIEQRVSRGGRKSTVGTTTEIFHFLRLLFAKIGVIHCPVSGLPLIRQNADEISEKIILLVKKTPPQKKIRILAPLIIARKGFHTQVGNWAAKHKIDQLLVDGKFFPTKQTLRLDRFREHTIYAVIDDFDKKTDTQKISESVNRALDIGRGIASTYDHSGKIKHYNIRLTSPATGESFPDLSPHHFSFNSPHGWCATCHGYGSIQPEDPVSSQQKKHSQPLIHPRSVQLAKVHASTP